MLGIQISVEHQQYVAAAFIFLDCADLEIFTFVLIHVIPVRSDSNTSASTTKLAVEEHSLFSHYQAPPYLPTSLGDSQMSSLLHEDTRPQSSTPIGRLSMIGSSHPVAKMARS